MIEISGISIDNINRFQGTDGEGVQGDLYLYGKKIGFFSDYGDGAEMSISVNPEFDINKLKKEIETIDAYRSYSFYYGDAPYRMDYNLTSLIYELLDLEHFRDSFKKAYAKNDMYALVYVLIQRELYEVEVPKDASDADSYRSAYNRLKNSGLEFTDEEWENTRKYLFRSLDDFDKPMGTPIATNDIKRKSVKLVGEKSL